MARFQILVTDTGKTLITTAEQLRPEEARMLHRMFEEWRNTEESILVMVDAEIMRITEIEIDDVLLQEDVSRETISNLMENVEVG